MKTGGRQKAQITQILTYWTIYSATSFLDLNFFPECKSRKAGTHPLHLSDFTSKRKRQCTTKIDNSCEINRQN